MEEQITLYYLYLPYIKSHAICKNNFRQRLCGFFAANLDFFPLTRGVYMTKEYDKFNDYLHDKGLRITRQRNRIAEVLFADDGHLSAEELYTRLREEKANVGQATVYRTLKHLCAAGLARELNFDDGILRYEAIHGQGHHDHLICEVCNIRIEVVDEEIERLQVDLAKKHGFMPTRHRLNLYGICQDCRQKGKPA